MGVTRPASPPLLLEKLQNIEMYAKKIVIILHFGVKMLHSYPLKPGLLKSPY